MIDITGLDKAAVLKALYDNASPRGLGFFAAIGTSMSVEDCQRYVEAGQLDLDYLHGRVMKVDLRGNTFDPWLYDRDNGAGAAARAVDAIR